MKVTCEKCGTTYRVPDEKLVKEISRATCKKCGNKIIILKKPPAGGLIEHPSPPVEEEKTVVATVPELESYKTEHLFGHVEKDKDIYDGLSVSSPHELGHLFGGESRLSFATVEKEKGAKEKEESKSPFFEEIKGKESIHLQSSHPPVFIGEEPDTLPYQEKRFTFPPEETRPKEKPVPQEVIPPPSYTERLPVEEKPPIKPPVSEPESRAVSLPSPIYSQLLIISLIGFTAPVIFILSNAWRLSILTFSGFIISIYIAISLLIISISGIKGKEPTTRSIFISPLIGCILLFAILYSLYGIGEKEIFEEGGKVDKNLLKKMEEVSPVIPEAERIVIPMEESPLPPSEETKPIEVESRIEKTIEKEVKVEPEENKNRNLLKKPIEKVETPDQKVEKEEVKTPPLTKKKEEKKEIKVASTVSLPTNETGLVKTPEKKEVPVKEKVKPQEESKKTGQTLSPAIIDIIISNNAGIKRCFQKELSRGTKLQGKIVLSFIINPEGNVNDAWLEKSSFSGTPLEDCLADSAKRLTFPPFKGEPKKLSYPFIF